MTSVIHDPGWTPPPPLGPGSHVVSMSADLPKGGSWFSHLAGLLENARAGIICVTPENYASPWLLFEAGALIRCDREVALFPVLFDLPAASLEGPLALVQGTVIDRDAQAIKREVLDLLNRVVAHVNAFPEAPNRLTVDQPSDVNAAALLPVDDPWDTFATTVLQLEPPSTLSIFDRFPQLFERKTFQESFHDCADQRWLDRYAGARIARDAMEKQRSRIATALPPGAELAYGRLSAAVDSYAMAIAGQLLEERRFGTDDQGHLNDVDGRLAVCERRRKAIRAAYIRLRDPVPPVFDDARIYEELPDLEERKIRLNSSARAEAGQSDRGWAFQYARLAAEARCNQPLAVRPAGVLHPRGQGERPAVSLVRRSAQGPGAGTEPARGARRTGHGSRPLLRVRSDGDTRRQHRRPASSPRSAVQDRSEDRGLEPACRRPGAERAGRRQWEDQEAGGPVAGRVDER